MRPTFLRSSAPAMPSTTVQKMTGAMIILMSLMKPSPKGFMAAAVAGAKTPSRTPAVMATRTWKYRERMIRRCNFMIGREAPSPYQITKRGPI